MSDVRIRRIETAWGMPMSQQLLACEGLEKHRKKTRREQFLEEMEQIIPWPELAAVIEPFYPKPEVARRRPIGIKRKSTAPMKYGRISLELD